MNRVEMEMVPGAARRRSTVDQAGRIQVDWQTNSLIVDGVQIAMELLVQCVNPDPSRYFIASRNGDQITVVSAPVSELTEPSRKELSAFRQEEQSLAFEHAVQILEGSCLPVGPDGEDWWDTAVTDEEAGQEVKRAELYLDTRGLLYRHPLELSWVSVRDETEAVTA